MAERSLAKIVSAHLCTGCGLCAGIVPDSKVSMVMGNDGYLRPQIHKGLDPDEDALVANVCPGNHIKHDKSQIKYEPLWGPVVSVNTGYAIDPEVRYQGSSGGAISALLVYLLDFKIVDFVVHIAASETEPLKNEIRLSRSREEVLLGAGSRYSPSSPLESISALLDLPGKFAFVGKPCDVAGLRNLARVDKRVNEKVVYCIAFFCAGVPSQLGTFELLEKLGVDRDELKKFSYRGEGWPGKAKAITKNGKVSEMDYATSWGTILNRHLQFRCKICPDGTGEFADVACADAWFGKDGYPEFSEQDGRSLILARTIRGAQLIRNAVLNDCISISDSNFSEVLKMQPYQAARKISLKARLLALMIHNGCTPAFVNLKLLKCSVFGGVLKFIRGFFGMWKRIPNTNGIKDE